ncbi:hypothetical protein Tco_0976063 [Tanacetum coccineum]|uniref:Uncharacterized protein n=1 Tax=Tanacetum coccineum TaxID=301880 RepID=A0ABQ5EG69_9ASTR
MRRWWHDGDDEDGEMKVLVWLRGDGGFAGVWPEATGDGAGSREGSECVASMGRVFKTRLRRRGVKLSGNIDIEFKIVNEYSVRVNKGQWRWCGGDGDGGGCGVDVSGCGVGVAAGRWWVRWRPPKTAPDLEREVSVWLALEACLVNEGITLNDNTYVTESNGTESENSSSVTPFSRS